MIKPFADEEVSLEIGELKVENRLDRVAIYGSIDLTRDEAGLALALELKDLVCAVVSDLEDLKATGQLPLAVEVEPPVKAPNPF